jgi:hypothetical protein
LLTALLLASLAILAGRRAATAEAAPFDVTTATLGYRHVVGALNQMLYSPLAFKPITEVLAAVWTLDGAHLPRWA